LESYSLGDVTKILENSADAILLVDGSVNKYRAVSRKGIFEKLISEEGEYKDLIEKLWIHLSDTNEKISKDYSVFVSYYGKFEGKYSRRLNVRVDGSEQPHVIQMTVYPMPDPEKYIFVMDELDDDEYVDEFMTTKKVTTIQNTYLFSMYVDLVRDTTSSISITEISDDTVNASIKYSDWRLMIVNMIWPEDQEQFLRRTDPEYLKKNFSPGRTSSFDCQMQNLEGKYIWVKLIFSRAKTQNEDDFRFVFMVQNIHENSIELLSTLKKYEEMALTDSLTGLFNHGGIETEMYNAIENRKKDGEPVSLMMLDIDYFKNVNDNHGHSVGDITLKKFAEVLTEYMTGEKGFVGRWGGEEFVIICYGREGDEAYTFADNLRKKVEETEFPEIKHITCSVGITDLRDEDSFDDAFDRMDKAMYISKENGRNITSRL